MNNLLSKLTIVIPTYNRQRYALRNMGLWSGTGATVHVLDGSPEAICSEHLAGFSSNIHYHHFPVPIWQRLAKVVEAVDTEYASFLADDDILIPSAVKACILELEQNQDLIACCGRGIDKSLVANLTVHRSTIKNNQESYKRGASGAVDQDKPVERMIFHMNPYIPSTFYAVCRSQKWCKVINLLSSKQFSSGVVGELQFELSMSFYGKVKVIDELAWLRSGENPTASEGFELSFYSWFLSQQYHHEVDDFLTLTATDLAIEGNLDFGAIRSGLEQACRAYVAYCDKNYQYNDLVQPSPSNAGCSSSNVSQTLKGIFRKCINGFTPSLKVFIKKSISRLPASLLAVFPDSLRFRPYIDVVKGLESAGLHIDWGELNTILEKVREFHENRS